MHRRTVIVIVAACAAPAAAQLRIVSLNASNYQSNIAQPRAGMSTILQAIGSTVSDDPRMPGDTGIAKPIDVLCLQETFTPATTGAGYANLLNQIYGVSTYSYGTMSGATTGNGSQGIVYNTATVQLLGEATVGTTSGTGMARQQVRHRIRPVGYTSTAADVYIYNGHWKSSDGDSARRAVEANTIRTDVATNLPANANVIYLGDFNVPSSSDAGYAALTASGVGQAFDPINTPGNWSDNTSFRNIHTQSPWSSSLNPGFNGAPGGMDDRYDHQAITANLNDGEGVAYIPNSYFVMGNNGSHALGQPLNSGSGASPAVLNALSSILDHLPVVADYQLPAKMTLSVAVPPPPEVIVGASVSVTFNVRNTAPVATANGADELDYTISSSTGSFSGITAATTAGNNHTFSFVASSIITSSFGVAANSTSQAVASASLATSSTTKDHANPSLSSASNVLTQTIDFGIHALGSTPPADVPFSLYNRPGPFSSLHTAGLDLDAVNGTGDVSVLPLEIAVGGPFIFAGQSRLGSAGFDGSAVGAYSAQYTLMTSDQDLPGAIARDTLTLTLLARVALGGDADLSNTVDIDDFGILASNFNAAGTWHTGDFNRDGLVDIDDFGILASNFNQSITPIVSHRPQAVPEPAVLGTLILSTLIARRRRF